MELVREVTPRPVAARAALRGLASSILVSVLGTALLVSAVFSRWGLVYCPWMQETRISCCCPGQSPAADDGPTIGRAPCCEERSFPAAEVASPGKDERVSPASAPAAAGSVVLPPAPATVTPLMADGARAAAARSRERERTHRPPPPLRTLTGAFLI